MVVQTSPIPQITVTRVRLRSMICVPPDDEKPPTPKAPERPESLPECISTVVMQEMQSSMCTATMTPVMIADTRPEYHRLAWINPRLLHGLGGG